MFSYNFKRLLNLIGINLFKKLILSIKNQDTEEFEKIKQETREYILLNMLFFIYIFTLLGRYDIKIKQVK